MRKRRILINILTSFLIVVLILISLFSLVLVVFNFTHIKSDVNQLSMYPTLNGSGDVVYVNRCKPVARGDIIVAFVSWNADPIIKRAVALPGDTLYMLEEGGNFNVYVNNKLFYSVPPYISCPTDDGQLQQLETRPHYTAFNNYLAWQSDSTFVEDGIQKLRLNQGEYFLLGDNWALSEDSTTRGPVMGEEILGSVDIVVHNNQNLLNTLLSSILKNIFSFN